MIVATFVKVKDSFLSTIKIELDHKRTIELQKKVRYNRQQCLLVTEATVCTVGHVKIYGLVSVEI